MPLGLATRLTIRVKAPEEEHTLTIAKVLSWLDGVTTSPSERLRWLELLGLGPRLRDLL
jgi:hypothetical protein